MEQEQEKLEKKKEFREKLAKNGIVLVDVYVSNMPLRVFKRFKKAAKLYGDNYWACISELMTKAEAYDYITQYGDNADTEYEETFVTDIEEPEEKGERLTFGGLTDNG